MDMYKIISRSARFNVDETMITVSFHNGEPRPLYDMADLTHEELLRFAALGLRLSAGVNVEWSNVRTQLDFINEHHKSLVATVKRRRNQDNAQARQEATK